MRPARCLLAVRTHGVGAVTFRNLALSALLVLVGGLGCENDHGTASNGWAPSLTTLGTLVLDGFQVGDTALLASLRLTREEHNEEIWPELPVASSGTNFTAEMAWSNIGQRDRRAMSRNLSWFHGQAVTFQRAECRGPTETFPSFQVHTDCWVRFRLQDGPAEAQLFKDVVERNAQFKIFRYYDEALRRLEPDG